MTKKARKYGYGTSNVGNNFIESPATANAKNDIMIAKANLEAESNPWIPVVLTAGQMISSGINSGKFAKKPSQNIGDGEGTEAGTNQGELAGKWMNPQDTDNFLNGIGMGAFGNDGSQSTSEIEGEEVIETPDGQVKEVQGPSHEQGGVQANLPQGTRVYSKRVEKFGESMAERKIAREKKKANLQDLLDKNKDDIAIRNAHGRTLESLAQQEQEDLQLQNIYGMMAAIHEFAYGTGEEGIGNMYALGSDGTEEDPFPKPIVGEADYDTDVIKNIQTAIGTTVDGIWGKNSNKALRDWHKINRPELYAASVKANGENYEITPGRLSAKTANKMGLTQDAFKFKGAETPDTTGLVKADSESTGVLKSMEDYYQDSKGTNKNDTLNLPKDITDEEDATKANSNKIHQGDIISLLGDAYSAFKPMQNTLANRASDTPNVNSFKDFGKDALDANLNAMEFAAGNKASSMRAILSQANGSKRASRNRSRGVNQLQAFDLATDLGVNDAEQSANDAYVNTMTQLFANKSQLENAQDSAVMQGEAGRDLADRQDKDNFYTQIGKDIATKGEGIQQIGKDVNSIEENNMMMNIMNNLSKYGLAFDSKGNIIETNKGK